MYASMNAYMCSMETCTYRRLQFSLSIGTVKLVRLKAASLGFHRAFTMFERDFGLRGIESKVYVHTER